MIAAVARSRGASLATRNVKDFDDCGIQVINPWSGAAGWIAKGRMVPSPPQ